MDPIARVPSAVRPIGRSLVYIRVAPSLPFSSFLSYLVRTQYTLFVYAFSCSPASVILWER
jgi:hypothetical protein